jgi:hypothetical protein
MQSQETAFLSRMAKMPPHDSKPNNWKCESDERIFVFFSRRLLSVFNLKRMFSDRLQALPFSPTNHPLQRISPMKPGVPRALHEHINPTRAEKPPNINI